MGPSRCTSHPKEDVLRIFIALKNLSPPRPGLNPRLLGPVESILTITTPRRRHNPEDYKLLQKLVPAYKAT
jgi:hypothetical protein